VTIGIAATGAQAGLAVFRALRAVERVGRGAIGGFASFVCITEAGALVRAETQRGGTATLFVDGEATGVAPPPAIAQARFAAVMSSGPDRPPPLAQFTPGDAAVGLVTGHRLPNMPGVDGGAVNVAVLDRMRAGASSREAALAVLARNPETDAGIIALDLAGGLVAANSDLVAARGDLGFALERDAATGAGVAVLHNAIHPAPGLAPLAAATALDAMNPPDRVDFHVTITAGTPVATGPANALVLGDDERVARIEVTRATFLTGTAHGAVIGPDAVVRRGDEVLGRPTSEPYAVVEDGVVRSLSGLADLRLGVRATRRDGT
jgi:hypothetical protein